MRSRRGAVSGRNGLLGLAGVLASGMLVACVGSDDEGAAGDSDLADGFSVSGAIAEVPAFGDDAPLIHTADLREATELAGLEYPESGSRDDVAPWLMGLTGASRGEGPVPPVFVPMPTSFNLEAASPDDFAELLGFSILDAESFVEASAPPRTFATVTGDIGEESVADDLVEVDDGILSDRDDDDLAQDLTARSAANRLGAPVRVAAQDGRVALSTVTPLVRGWLDGGESLADDDALSAVAEALDARDVVSAALTPISGADDPVDDALGDRASPEQLADVQEQVDAMIPAESFDAVGIGWSVADDSAQVHAVYHFGSDDAASDAAEVLESAYREGVSVQDGRPFSDRFTVQDVQADGPVVVASVSHAQDQPPGLLYNVLVQRDVLFMSR